MKTKSWTVCDTTTDGYVNKLLQMAEILENTVIVF